MPGVRTPESLLVPTYTFHDTALTLRCVRRIEGSSVAARDTATNFTAGADFQREFTGFHATTVQLVAADRLTSELSPVGR